MRHQLSGRQLSRNSSHRKALMRNMCAALIRAETIRTTLPKAKELRRVVEPLITLGKNDSLPGRRRAWITRCGTTRSSRSCSRTSGRGSRPGPAATRGSSRWVRVRVTRREMALMQLVELTAAPVAPARGQAREEEGKSRAERRLRRSPPGRRRRRPARARPRRKSARRPQAEGFPFCGRREPPRSPWRSRGHPRLFVP